MQLPQSRPIGEKYAVVDSQLLGKGSTGNVYLGFLQASPQCRVAVKAINLKEIDNQVTRYLLSCEIAALSNLGKIQQSGHENVVRLLEVVIQEGYIYLVTELLEGGTLAEYLRKHPQGVPEEEAVVLFRQIAEGYRHIRSKGVVHRDIKPDNILFRTAPEVSKRLAIIDFGYCEMREVPNRPQMFYNVGSPKYMAPEAYIDNIYSEKSDVWAMGVILYEMLVGRTCDQGLKMEAYLELIRKSGIPLPNTISPFFRHILSKMLCYNHQARYDCLQVIKELENFQTSFQPFQSQANMKPFCENATGNDFFRGRNNPVFKSAMIGQPPGHLFHSQHIPNIPVHQPPTNIPPQSDNQGEKRFIKSNSTRNVANQISFNIAPKNILQKVENAHSPPNRGIEVKSSRPTFQQNTPPPLDASFPSHKVHFRVVPHNHRQNVPAQSLRYHHQQPDENSLQVQVRSANFERRVQMVQQPMMSIEKGCNNRLFHSPQRKPAPSPHFFTEKKTKEQDPPSLRKLVEMRPFNGQVRRVLPLPGFAPLFH